MSEGLQLPRVFLKRSETESYQECHLKPTPGIPGLQSNDHGRLGVYVCGPKEFSIIRDFADRFNLVDDSNDNRINLVSSDNYVTATETGYIVTDKPQERSRDIESDPVGGTNYVRVYENEFPTSPPRPAEQGTIATIGLLFGGSFVNAGLAGNTFTQDAGDQRFIATSKPAAYFGIGATFHPSALSNTLWARATWPLTLSANATVIIPEEILTFPTRNLALITASLAAGLTISRGYFERIRGGRYNGIDPFARITYSLFTLGCATKDIKIPVGFQRGGRSVITMLASCTPNGPSDSITATIGVELDRRFVLEFNYLNGGGILSNDYLSIGAGNSFLLRFAFSLF